MYNIDLITFGIDFIIQLAAFDNPFKIYGMARSSSVIQYFNAFIIYGAEYFTVLTIPRHIAKTTRPRK
jgi:hypothetical protein